MDEMKKQAKTEVLKELIQMAKSKMRDNTKSGLDELKNAKKVTVMAPDEESLKEGLEVAQDTVDMIPEMELPVLEEVIDDLPLEVEEEEQKETPVDIEALLKLDSDDDDGIFSKKKKKEIDEEDED